MRYLIDIFAIKYKYHAVLLNIANYLFKKSCILDRRGYLHDLDKKYKTYLHDRVWYMVEFLIKRTLRI